MTLFLLLDRMLGKWINVGVLDLSIKFWYQVITCTYAVQEIVRAKVTNTIVVIEDTYRLTVNSCTAKNGPIENIYSIRWFH